MHRVGLTGEDFGAHITKRQERGFVEVRKAFVEKQSRRLVSLTASGRTALLEYRRILRQALETIPQD